MKHTVATEIVINMDIRDCSTLLNIRDNGHGINENDFEKARQQNRIGIYGMKERAELLGGSFFIRTHNIGGTEIMVSIPLKQREGCQDGKDNQHNAS